MPGSLRYRNPVICEHLAGQYVAGVMSARVRKRTEAIRQNTPELDRAIAQLSDHFTRLHERLNEAVLPEKRRAQIWESIDKNIYEQTKSDNKTLPFWHHLWNKVAFWRLSTGFGALTSLVLAAFLIWGDLHTPAPLSGSGPSYLANMSADNDPEKSIQFVISAYAKQEERPSRLHIQWLKGERAKFSHPLHLWAEEKETGKLIYIGLRPDTAKAWDLTKASWTAITNSHRLLMTKDDQIPSGDNIAYSGLCLQLGEWNS
ncbi:MAG: hypothetical protein AAFZ92_07850 [Pseudomonadota bacterium]